ncbi:hypothetical protein P885DRAFT_74640 [Corynascus similis CBS 632.67]
MAVDALFAAIVAASAFVALLVTPFLSSLILAAEFSLAALVATSFRLVTLLATPSLFCCTRFSTLCTSILFFFVALVPSVRADPWSRDLCVRPTSIGSSDGGEPFTILGNAGTSVSTLRLYRNNGALGYLRGVVVVFSDGTETVAGVRKDQYSELTFDEGEFITGMTLWSVAPLSRKFRKAKSKSPRAARIDITTNQRFWGYGVDNTSKLSSKAVNVASGILVGFQGRAGDDMDQLAPIFLRKVDKSVVDDVVFERLPGNDGLELETLKEGTAVWKGTNYSYTFSGSTTRDTSTTFSSATSHALSSSTTFTASLPIVLESTIGVTWSFSASSSQEYHKGRSTELSWSSTVAMSSDMPAVSCSAMVWRGQVRLRWSGTQTVTAGDASVSFPTSGTLTQVDYGKVETVCRPVGASVENEENSSSSSSSSSSSVKLAKRWAG